VARGERGIFNHFRDEAEGSRELLAAGPSQSMLAGARGGARTSLERGRGLGVERSTVWVRGALGVEGACWPSSSTYMASSLSEEASDSSSSESGGASGLWTGDWSSPAFFVEGIVVVAAVRAVGGGRRIAIRDGSGVPSLWAGRVLASVYRTSMMKRTIGAGGVFLGASGRGVSKAVAVGALAVTGGLGRFLDLEPL